MSLNAFQTGKFIYDGVSYGVTASRVTANENLVDVTDTDTSSGQRDFIAGGRPVTEFSIEMFRDDGDANPPLGSVNSCTIQFEGENFVGNAILTSREFAGQIDNAVQLNVSGQFTTVTAPS